MKKVIVLFTQFYNGYVLVNLCQVSGDKGVFADIDWGPGEHFDYETLSQTDFELKHILKNYPNPASHLLDIKSSSILKEFILHNVYGQQVLRVIPSGAIDLTGIESGLDFAQI